MTAAGESLSDEAVAALGLDGHGVRRLTGGRVNDVWLAQRARQRVVVRRSPPYRTLEEVEYERSALEALAAAGALVARQVMVPQLLDGRAWAVFE